MPAKGQEKDVIERIKAKTIYIGTCWVWGGKKVGLGYGEIWYKGKGTRINRLIAHLYHGMDLNDPIMQANHKSICPIKSCWNPDHIYVGTQQDNVDNAIELGTHCYGTANINGGSNFNKETWMKNRHGK
jgi:hypothetical protein